MKKMLIVIAIFLVSIMTINVDAEGIGFEKYKSLDVSHAFIVGDYMFDLDYGFSPSLQDFMTAARTIPESENATAYEIFYLKNYDDYFERTELFRNDLTTDTTVLDNMSFKYVYRSNIKNAKTTDFDLID